MGDLFRENACPIGRTPLVSEQQNTPNYIELAAEIVSAFVANNSVPVAELPALIGNVHDALNKVATGSTQKAEETKQAPAVPIKKSMSPTSSSASTTARSSKALSVICGRSTT